MDSPTESTALKVHDLYSFPAFSVEDLGGNSEPLPSQSEELQAFEQCLQLYEEAKTGRTLMQSENGNFLLPTETT